MVWQAKRVSVGFKHRQVVAYWWHCTWKIIKSINFHLSHVHILCCQRCRIIQIINKADSVARHLIRLHCPSCICKLAKWLVFSVWFLYFLILWMRWKRKYYHIVCWYSVDFYRKLLRVLTQKRRHQAQTLSPPKNLTVHLYSPFARCKWDKRRMM